MLPSLIKVILLVSAASHVYGSYVGGGYHYGPAYNRPYLFRPDYAAHGLYSYLAYKNRHHKGGYYGGSHYGGGGYYGGSHYGGGGYYGGHNSYGGGYNSHGGYGGHHDDDEYAYLEDSYNSDYKDDSYGNKHDDDHKDSYGSSSHHGSSSYGSSSHHGGSSYGSSSHHGGSSYGYKHEGRYGNHLQYTKDKINTHIAKLYKLGKRRLTVQVDYNNTPLKYLYLQKHFGMQHPLAGTKLGYRFGIGNSPNYGTTHTQSSHYKPEVQNSYNAPKYESSGYPQPSYDVKEPSYHQPSQSYDQRPRYGHSHEQTGFSDRDRQHQPHVQDPRQTHQNSGYESQSNTYQQPQVQNSGYLTNKEPSNSGYSGHQDNSRQSNRYPLNSRQETSYQHNQNSVYVNQQESGYQGDRQHQNSGYVNQPGSGYQGDRHHQHSGYMGEHETGYQGDRNHQHSGYMGQHESGYQGDRHQHQNSGYMGPHENNYQGGGDRNHHTTDYMGHKENGYQPDRHQHVSETGYSQQNHGGHHQESGYQRDNHHDHSNPQTSYMSPSEPYDNVPTVEEKSSYIEPESVPSSTTGGEYMGNPGAGNSGGSGTASRLPDNKGYLQSI